MKPLLTGLLLLYASICFAAVSSDEIVKLSQLKTSDEVILQLIQKEGLRSQVTSKDVVYLKEHGVSDRVIQYMLQISKADAQQLAANMRSYYTTGKDGKKVRVITNLDEKGKRMGGEIPPEPEPSVQSAQRKEPQEVRVVVENPSHTSEYDARPEYSEPEYVDDRYLPPSYFQQGYPSYYSPYSPYSPNYYYPDQHNRLYQPHNPNTPDWRYDQGLNKPRPPSVQHPSITQTPSHGGTSRAKPIRH